MATKCHVLENGELFTVDTKKEILKFRCCDCGLVHWADIDIRGKVVSFRLFRDNRATAAVRRWNHNGC